MINELIARFKQGHRTISFPHGLPPALSPRFRGVPVINWKSCCPNCNECSRVCPTGAINVREHTIDLGKCLFCLECSKVCPAGVAAFSADYRMAVRMRSELLLDENCRIKNLAHALRGKMLSMFRRSFKLRQVSAGGCNACEADVNVLTTIGWDLSRFGIQFVASPRHADGILVTGPVTKNMELALKKTWEAVPEPKLVIAAGACAVSGGLYNDHEETCGGLEKILPVDLYIPGCPPHPLTILDGLLRLLDRIDTPKNQ